MCPGRRERSSLRSQTPPAASAVEASPASRFAFPPAQGLTPPAGAEAIRFTLADFVVEGQFPELEARAAALEASRAGREINVAEVSAFAAELQQAYFAAGYPLARVVVPPQHLGGDGAVRISVIDGFVERIDTAQVPQAARARVERVMGPLIGQRRPTRTMLERRLLLAGDTAGLALSSTLTPGGAVGATVLVLSGEHEAVSGVFAADNRVSEELGRAQTTLSLALNSPFGAGERFYATFAGHPDGDVFSDDATRRYVAFGMDLPIGDNGLLLGLSGDYSSTRPGGDIAAQELESEYARVGIAVSYPFVRARAHNLVARVGFDAVSDIQRTNLGGPPATALSADRLRVVRLGLDGNARLGEGDTRFNYGLDLAQGLDGLGARTAADASPTKPLSRDGADADFTSFGASASLATRGPVGTGVTFAARGAMSADPLLRSEQFSPAGWDGLSGPPPGMLIGDAGWVTRAELDRPFGSDNAVAAPYVFALAAEVSLEQPSALERKSTGASGYGAGLRFGFGRRAQGGHAFTAALEWSRLTADDPTLERDWAAATFAVRF